MLAGPRGLDRRVQRQDVGLEGDALDQLRDLADAGRGLGDRGHRVVDRAHVAVAAPRRLAELRGDLTRPVGRVAVAAHLVGDLAHARGGLLQAGRLGLGAPGEVMVALRDRVRHRPHLAEFMLRVRHQRAQVHAQLRQLAIQQPRRRGRLGGMRTWRAQVAGREALRHPQARAQGGTSLADAQRRDDPDREPPPERRAKTAVMQREFAPTRPAFGVHPRIQRLGRPHLFARGLAAHRQVARRLAVAQQRRHVGHHPVMVAILAAVLHQARPGPPGLHGRPEVAEGLGRHVGMADQVVRPADQLLAAEAADRDEHVVAVQDPALQVSGGHQRAAFGEREFPLRDRQIRSHRCVPCTVSLDLDQDTASMSWSGRHLSKIKPLRVDPGEGWRAVKECRRAGRQSSVTITGAWSLGLGSLRI